jgi:hypothetical protein
MNAEVKKICFQFIIHHSAFILSKEEQEIRDEQGKI